MAPSCTAVTPSLAPGAHFGIEFGDPMWAFMQAMFQGLTAEHDAWAWMLVEPVPYSVAQLKANLKAQVRGLGPFVAHTVATTRGGGVGWRQTRPSVRRQ